MNFRNIILAVIGILIYVPGFGIAQISGVFSNISPNSGTAGNALFEITAAITIPIGKSDSIITSIPFQTSTAVVKYVKVNGIEKYLLNSTSSPIDSTYVTWTYIHATRKIILQTHDTLSNRTILTGFLTNLPRLVSTNLSFNISVTSRLNAETITNSIDSGLGFSITPDAAALIGIETLPDGTGGQITSIAVSSDTMMTLYAIARDIFRNYVDTVRCRWRIEPAVGSIDQSDSSVTIHFDPVKKGLGDITAGHHTLGTGKLSISIYGGATHHVVIRNEALGGGMPLDTITMSADSSLSLYAAVYDRDENYLTDSIVHWRTTNDLDRILDSIGAKVIWNPIHAWRSGKILAYHSDTLADTSGTITIIPGRKRFISIVDTLGKNVRPKTIPAITTDDSIALFAAFLDADSNFISNPNVFWSDTPDFAEFTINNSQSTMLLPTKAKDGLIIAEAEGFRGSIFTSVTAGSIHHIILRSESAGGGDTVAVHRMSTDSSLIVFAAAYDRWNNFIADTPVTWTIATEEESTVTNNATSILFTPSTAGIRVVIHAKYSSAIFASTDSIDIGTGRASYVWIVDTAGSSGTAIDRLNMTADSSITLYAAFYDADSNFIDNTLVSWIDNAGLGEFSVAIGNKTTFSAIRAGKGIIKAAGDGLQREIFISVVPGIDHHLLIRTQPFNGGDTIKSITIPADTSMQLYSSLYDRNGNFTGNKPSVWSMTGLDGSFSASNSSNIRYDPKTSGLAGRIHAVFGDTIASMTDVITIVPGAVARIEIAVSEADSFAPIQQLYFRSGESRRLFAIAFDADSNLIGTIAVQWSEKASIGVFSEVTGDSALFTARESGFSIIEITNGIFSKRISLRVLFSPIYRLAISRNTASLIDTISSIAMTADSVVLLKAIAFDSLGNFVGDSASVSWYIITGTDTVLFAADTNRWTFTPLMNNLTAQIECRTVDGTVRTTIPLNVYLPVALRYQLGSLDSTIAPPNDTMSFRFTLLNDGGINAILDTVTALRFMDGSGRSVTASLKQMDTIPTGVIGKSVETRSVVIPDSLVGETYTPYFTISGHDGLGQRISPVTLQGDPNSIYVPRVQSTMSVEKKKVTIEYDSVKITVYIRNYGAKVTDLSWGVLPDSSAFASLETIKGITELAEKSLDSVMMTGILDGGLDSGTIFLRSFLRGKVHGNVFTSISDNSVPVILQHEPKIAFIDSVFWPKRRTFGSSINLTAYIRNERGNTLTLDSATTRFEMTERTTSQKYTIGVDPSSVGTPLGSRQVRSDTGVSLSQIPPGNYEVRLLLAGIDGNRDPFTDTLTAPNDTLIIDRPAELHIYSNEKRAITVGQEVTTYPVVIKNTGTTTVSMSRSESSLMISNGQTYTRCALIDSATIPAGAQARVIFRTDSLHILPRGAYTHTLVFGGKDGNGETFLDTVSEGSVTLFVTEPPTLEQFSVNQMSGVFRGQMYFPTATVHNSGGTGLFINLNTTMTIYDGKDSMVFQLTDTGSIAKHETIDLKFGPKEINDTIDTFTAILTYSGTDQNGKPIHQTRINDAASIVVYAPKLTYQASSLAPRTIPAGTNSFPFSVRIKNSGNIAVTLDDSSYLNIGLIDTVTLSNFPTIAPGDSAILSFNPLTVPASWPSGTIPITLLLHGTYGTISRQLYSAVLADSIAVYKSNALSVSSLSPLSVTTGQRNVQFSASVINQGAVAVTLDPDTTQIRIGSLLMIPMSGKPVSIGPGGTAEMEFESFDVPGSPSGVVPIVLYLIAKDQHGNPVQTQFRTDITVHTGPVLVSVNPANDTIFVKRRPYAFRIPVMNSGDIGFTADTASSVMIGNDTALVSNIISAEMIASHAVHELSFRSIPFTDSPVGTIYPMNLRLTGLDANTKGLDTTLTAIRTVMVVDTLFPEIGRTGTNAANKINPDSILTGSQDSQLRFRIINRNKIALSIDSILFRFNGDTLGAYSVSGSSGALLIAPLDTLEKPFSVYAGPGVPLGATDIGMRVYYRLHTYDSSQASIELHRVHTWTVLPAPILKIVSVNSSLGTTPVTEGATVPFTITVAVRNDAQQSVRFDSSYIAFISGNSVMPDVSVSLQNGSSLVPGNILPPQSSDTLRFIVTKMGLYRGERFIFVQTRIYGTESLTNVRLADSTRLTDPRHPQITLLKRGNIEYVRVTSSKPTVDTGNTPGGHPRITTVVRNSGEGMLQNMRLDSIHWFYNGIRRTGFRYTWLNASEGISLPGNSTAAFLIGMTRNDISADSISGTLTASLFFSGQDPYNGNAVVVDSLSSMDGFMSGLVRFQRPAKLSIVSPLKILDPYDSIVVKNRTIYLHCTIRNEGSGTVLNITTVLETPNHNSKIKDPVRTIPRLDSLQEYSLDFEILTADTTDITETLLFKISDGTAFNTDSLSAYGEDSISYTIRYLPGPPLITEVKYIDNGYRRPPDARLNKGDLIKIKFNDAVQNTSTIPADSLASKYFSIIPAGYHFGRTDQSKVRKASEVFYPGTDDDSVLFIELGEDALMAIGDSLFGKNNSQFQKQQLNSATNIIINPVISTSILIGSKGNDAGLQMFREILAQQLVDTVVQSSQHQETKSTILSFNDPIPPIVNPIVRRKTDDSYQLNVFITGMNLIHVDTLVKILERDGRGVINPLQYLNNYSLLYSEIEKLPGNLLDSIRASMQQAHHGITDTSARYYLNPEFVFYNEILPESISVKLINKNNGFSSFAKGNTQFLASPTNNYIFPTSNVGFQGQFSNSVAIEDSVFAEYTIWVQQEAIPHVIKDTIGLYSSPPTPGQRNGFSIITAKNPYYPMSNDRMVIQYTLGQDVKSAEVTIIDAAGRSVKKWSDLPAQKGRHRIVSGWDGRNERGVIVSKGVFLAVLSTGNTVHSTWIISIE